MRNYATERCFCGSLCLGMVLAARIPGSLCREGAHKHLSLQVLRLVQCWGCCIDMLCWCYARLRATLCMSAARIGYGLRHWQPCGLYYVARLTASRVSCREFACLLPNRQLR